MLLFMINYRRILLRSVGTRPIKKVCVKRVVLFMRQYCQYYRSNTLNSPTSTQIHQGIEGLEAMDFFVQVQNLLPKTVIISQLIKIFLSFPLLVK